MGIPILDEIQTRRVVERMNRVRPLSQEQKAYSSAMSEAHKAAGGKDDIHVQQLRGGLIVGWVDCPLEELIIEEARRRAQYEQDKAERLRLKLENDAREREEFETWKAAKAAESTTK